MAWRGKWADWPHLTDKTGEWRNLGATSVHWCAREMVYGLPAGGAQLSMVWFGAALWWVLLEQQQYSWWTSAPVNWCWLVYTSSGQPEGHGTLPASCVRTSAKHGEWITHDWCANGSQSALSHNPAAMKLDHPLTLVFKSGTRCVQMRALIGFSSKFVKLLTLHRLNNYAVD